MRRRLHLSTAGVVLRNWHNSAVAGIRLLRQLSEDELPYSAIEHAGLLAEPPPAIPQSPSEPAPQACRWWRCRGGA